DVLDQVEGFLRIRPPGLPHDAVKNAAREPRILLVAEHQVGKRDLPALDRKIREVGLPPRLENRAAPHLPSDEERTRFALQCHRQAERERFAVAGKSPMPENLQRIAKLIVDQDLPGKLATQLDAILP